MNALANCYTPLHPTSINEHLDIVKLLVGRGANIDSLDDKEQTSLHCAAENGFFDISRLLVETGASVFARDNDGHMPFHKASAGG